MEVWLTKLEKHLEQFSADDTKKLLHDKQMELTAAAYQGGLLLSQGESRQVHFDHFRKRLDLCEFFSIPTLILAPDFTTKMTATDIERALVSLKQAAQWAQSVNVTLALEFRGSEKFCSCLSTALALIEGCGEPNVGVNFDVHHYYTGPSKYEDLGMLSVERLAHVQVSDLSGVPREMATDAHRILPGEGDFHLQPIFEHFQRIGYEGWVSLELMNPTLWEVGATQVAELGLGAVQRLIEVIPS